MIRFDLHCGGGHVFEAWFASGADFDEQKARALVTCPHCGSASVHKAPMAPAILSARGVSPPAPVASDGEPALSCAPDDATAPDRAAALQRLHAQVRVVRARCEDVGWKFAEEARRIHFGESKERGIVGHAHDDEIRALVEDEIHVVPLPVLPEDRN